MPVRPFAAVAIALAVAACSDVSRIDTPVVGQLSWFAYLGGDDIRKGCVPGAPARYRFVYNAVFDEQVRSYDVTQTPDGASFAARVPTANPTLFEYQTNAAAGWSPRRADTRTIDRAKYLAIARQLEADGFGAAPDTTRNLSSWDFYWLVTACADGKFHINAWRNLTPEFAALRFPALLFAEDRTEIPVNPPRSNPYGDYFTRKGQGTPDRNFDVRLSPDGLANSKPVF
jgi:hypothetical protein